MIIEFFRNLFYKSKNETDMAKENPTLTLLKKALPENYEFNAIKEIYSVGSVEYNENSLKAMKNSILKNEIKEFTKNFSFDGLKDAIELLFFIKTDQSIQTCILFCPVELFENEYIIDISEFNFDKTNFNDLELIYKRVE